MESIITTVLTCLVTLIGIFVSAKSTRDKVTNELHTQNELQAQEISHIKDEIKEMKADVKSHNEYAKKFVELRGDFNLLGNRLEHLEKEKLQ